MVRFREVIIVVFSVLQGSFAQQYGFCHKLPSSTNISIGSTAEFHCTCHGGHAIVWYIDDEIAGQQNNAAENGINYQTEVRDGTFASTLSILATERNNNSRVECGLFEFGRGIRRFTTPEFALLRIQGYLAAPGDLEVIAQQNLIHLKWTPPFSLGGVHILGYYLTIIDITDDVNLITTETIYLNYTEREKKLTTEFLSPCRTYQFTISALNEVGNGSLSENINASFRNVPGPVEGDKVITRIELGSDVGVTFMFPVEDCPGRNADTYIAHLLTTQPQTYLCTHRELRTLSSMEEVVLNFTTSTDVLRLNGHYLGVVEAQNDMGGSNGSEIYFSTFDVQNIEHFEDPLGSICVLCIFANRSNAKGCHIKLEETMENSNSYRNTSRPACFRVTEGGNYTLLAYDIEENETDAPTDFSARRPAINRTIVATGPGLHHSYMELAVGIPVATIILAVLVLGAMCIPVIAKKYCHKEKDFSKEMNDY